VESEFVHNIVHCKQCQSTGLLVGMDQVMSEDLCYDCICLNKTTNKKSKQEKLDAWAKVRPACKQYPKRTEAGNQNQDLPHLYPGDRDVIAIVHPVVTVKRTYFQNKQLRHESISLLGDVEKIWVQVLPRTNFQGSLREPERMAKQNTLSPTRKELNSGLIICSGITRSTCDELSPVC